MNKYNSSAVIVYPAESVTPQLWTIDKHQPLLRSVTMTDDEQPWRYREIRETSKSTFIRPVNIPQEGVAKATFSFLAKVSIGLQRNANLVLEHFI